MQKSQLKIYKFHVHDAALSLAAPSGVGHGLTKMKKKVQFAAFRITCIKKKLFPGGMSPAPYFTNLLRIFGACRRWPPPVRTSGAASVQMMAWSQPKASPVETIAINMYFSFEILPLPWCVHSHEKAIMNIGFAFLLISPPPSLPCTLLMPGIASPSKIHVQ